MAGEEEKFSSGEDMILLLPYLSEGFCGSCRSLLDTRLQNLSVIGRFKGVPLSESSADSCSAHSSDLCAPEKSLSPSSSNISQVEESSDLGSRKTALKSDDSVDNSQSEVSPLGDGHVNITNLSPASMFDDSVDNSESEVSSSGDGHVNITDSLSASKFDDSVDNSESEVSSLGDGHVNITDSSSALKFEDSVDNSQSEVSSLEDGHVNITNSAPASISNGQPSVDISQSEVPILSEESDEEIRLSQVGWKNNFTHIERVNGKQVNVLQGLELHTNVFNAAEQKKIVDFVYRLQEMGQAGKLRKRTYSEPSKWNRGKGRVTLQFGCYYNYGVDRKGNPPGIVRGENIDPLPPMFKDMIKRLIRWYVLPPTCVPNSCIVNICDEGDSIPPHIDHHDFVRPFCTVSFLTECKTLFGAHLKTVGNGEFSGPVSIPLPAGSVLLLKGNAADVAKHCVPSVPGKRISITFRKMNDSKLPYKYLPDPELQGLEPLRRTPLNAWSSPLQQVCISTPKQNMSNSEQVEGSESGGVVKEMNNNNTSSSLDLMQDNFPPLGSLNRVNKRGSR